MSNPIQPFASNENGLIKNPKELLVIAEQKVGQLENRIRELEEQAKAGVETIDKLKWQTAQLRIGVTALATHFKQSPEEVKVIYDKYVTEQDEHYKKLADEAKAKIMQDLKDGKVPDLKVVDRATGEVVEFPKGE
jgi:uncharacterized coiled-coil protein SlyX